MQRYGGYDRATLLDPAGAQGVLAEMGLPPSQTHGQALDKIFDRVVEPQLVNTTFVHDYPVVISPLAKRKADDPEIVDRYELFGANFELANAFTELKRPGRPARAASKRRCSNARAAMTKCRNPIGISSTRSSTVCRRRPASASAWDRLVMLLTNQQSIREVILFPLQRPVTEHGTQDAGRSAPG